MVSVDEGRRQDEKERVAGALGGDGASGRGSFAGGSWDEAPPVRREWRGRDSGPGVVSEKIGGDFRKTYVATSKFFFFFQGE